MGEAHDLLGNLYERGGETDRALEEYRDAVRLRPDLDRAQLDLGATLAKAGDVTGAAAHLRAAAKAADSTIRNIALQLLAQLPR